ncbi:MAG TPA: amidase [Candidatus Tectomicrobia bacterium]|nr:amidase [Candidatus Tectomicrobia bacterium]
MEASELCYLSLRSLGTLMQRRELSPVEATETVLDRVEKFDRQLNSFITPLRDQAMAQARAAEREILDGHYRGPLHGVPIAAKDLYYTKGIRTTAGSKILSDFIPTYDATVIARLQDAGAILIGKLNMHEFARGATNSSSLIGGCYNPWDTLRVTGGSSGGSGAALAAGLCYGALGSDTGGSIRIPAAFCGVVGLKPTYGRVSRHGVFPLSWSLDHVGPMARTVADAALMLQVIAGHDRHDLTTRTAIVPDYMASLTGDIEGARLGIPQEFYFEQLDAEVADSVRAAVQTLERAGARVEEVSLPLSKYAAAAGRIISLTESAEIHEKFLKTRFADYSADVRAGFLVGQFILGKHYIKAQRLRSLIRQEMGAVLRRVDALVTPTVPVAAPRIGQTTVEVGPERVETMWALSRLTRPANLTGFPALSVPCGFTQGGLPIGLQLTGRPFAEATILQIAHAYEQETTWHQRRPLF